MTKLSDLLLIFSVLENLVIICEDDIYEFTPNEALAELPASVLRKWVDYIRTENGKVYIDLL